MVRGFGAAMRDKRSHTRRGLQRNCVPSCAFPPARHVSAAPAHQHAARGIIGDHRGARKTTVQPVTTPSASQLIFPLKVAGWDIAFDGMELAP